jgi:hypothetical protein
MLILYISSLYSIASIAFPLNTNIATSAIDTTKKLITFDNGETIDLLSDKYRKELV